MSKIPYEKLTQIWSDFVVNINMNKRSAAYKRIREIINYPDLNILLENITSVYTGLEGGGGRFRFAPIFYTPNELSDVPYEEQTRTAYIKLSGNTSIDMENACKYASISGKRHKLHYAFMGYIDNFTCDAVSCDGEYIIETFEEQQIYSAKNWYVNIWTPANYAIVQLIPAEQYKVLENLMYCIDKYGEYTFSNHFDSCNQYYCISKYTSLSAEQKLNYDFNALDNYNCCAYDNGKTYGYNIEDSIQKSTTLFVPSASQKERKYKK